MVLLKLLIRVNLLQNAIMKQVLGYVAWHYDRVTKYWIA